MPTPVILELIMKQDPSVKRAFSELVGEAQKLGRVPKAELLAPGQLEHLYIARQLMGDIGKGALFSGRLAQSALEVAATFEQLNAKLVSVTGSADKAAEKLDFSKRFAATTPFDVQGIVEATALLEGFKQNSEELLPVAANLAAAMGTDLKEATLAVGKAAAGSLEGFESLRNTYALTTSELVKFGLQTDKNGGVLARTPEQIEKNRKALVALINIRYGDAIGRQSQTLNGALSNLGDSAKTAADGFGQALIPISRLGVTVLADLINKVNEAPAPLKFLGIAGTIAVAGVAGMAAAVGGTIAALLLLQGALAATVQRMQMLKIEAPQASAALQTLTGGVTRVSGAMTAANLSRLALGTGLLALASVAATAGLAIADSWEKGAARLGDAIADSSRQAASANKSFRTVVDALSEAGKAAGVSVRIVGDAGQQMDILREAFAKIPQADIADAFVKAGISAEGLKEQLKGAERGATSLRERLELLLQAQAQFERVQGTLIQPLDPSDAQDEVIVKLRAIGLTVADVDEEVKRTQAGMARFREVGLSAAEGLKVFDNVITPLQNATAASEKLSKFIDLSKQVGTTRSLNAAMTALNTQIQANAGLAKVGTDNLDTLLAKVATAEGAIKEALLAQIGLVQQRIAIQADLGKAAEDAAKADVEAQELAFRRKKAIGEVNLHQELAFVEKRLAAAKKGSEEEVGLLERARQLKSDIRDKELKAAQDSLGKAIQAAKQGVDDAEAGLSPKSVAAALEEGRLGVQRWADANQPLLKQFPELKRELDQFGSSNAMASQRQNATDLKDALTTMVTGFSSAIAGAVGSQQQLVAVQSSIQALQTAMAAGLVDEKGARAEIAKLTNQQLQIEKQITQEKAQQKISLTNLDLQNNQGDLSLLQARKAQGENVDNAITANLREQLRIRLDIIEQEKQAAIAAGTDKVFATQEAERKVTAAKTQSTLAELQLATEQAQRINQQGQQRENNLLSGLEAERQVLEARKEAGQDVERELTQNHRAQVQERISLIELERQVAINGGQDRVLAEETAQGKLKQLRDAELADEIRKKAALDALYRVGGQNSPLNSNANTLDFGNFSLGGGFSLGGDSLRQIYDRALAPGRQAINLSRLRDDTASPNTRNLEVTKQINEAERQRRIVDTPPSGTTIERQEVSIIVDGAELQIRKPALKVAIIEALKEIDSDAELRGA